MTTHFSADVDIEPERLIALGIKFDVSHIVDRAITLGELD